MILSLKELHDKYALNVSGILHLGAHDLQEKVYYDEIGVQNVIWIEAIPEICERSKKEHPTATIYNYVVSEFDDESVTFNVSNNEQSSSILELDRHTLFYPNIKYVKQIVCKTKSLKTIVDERNINLDEFNFLTLDLQGIELRVIRGMQGYLNKIDYICTEVNSSKLYKDCDLVEDLDKYLKTFGFERVETAFTDADWGDAFYVKQKIKRVL